MAVKIVRQPNKIALLGAPTSAAALAAGTEGAPAALRAAGLIDRLTSIGYSVTDLGDDPQQLFQEDSESPRARNIPRIIKALEALKPRVEQAVKSAALPVILSGDCSVVLATIAGVRRYFRNVALVYVDRDADLNTPATTASGCVDGMVISHVIGRGAAELVRFWPEPPLVREPDIALFGMARLDRAEQEALQRIPLRRHLAADVERKGAAAAAEAAIEGIHASTHEFVLHVDVDVIADFAATKVPASDGLRLEEVRDALTVFAKQKHLAAIDVAGYDPTKDADGAGAKIVVDLLAAILKARLDAFEEAAAPPPATVSAESTAKAEPEPTKEISVPAATAGEAWSSDSLEETSSETKDSSTAQPSEPSSASGGNESQ